MSNYANEIQYEYNSNGHLDIFSNKNHEALSRRISQESQSNSKSLSPVPCWGIYSYGTPSYSSQNSYSSNSSWCEQNTTWTSSKSGMSP